MIRRSKLLSYGKVLGEGGYELELGYTNYEASHQINTVFNRNRWSKHNLNMPHSLLLSLNSLKMKLFPSPPPPPAPILFHTCYFPETFQKIARETATFPQMGRELSYLPDELVVSPWPLGLAAKHCKGAKQGKDSGSHAALFKVTSYPRLTDPF